MALFWSFSSRKAWTAPWAARILPEAMELPLKTTMFPFASGSAKSNLICPVNNYSLIGNLFIGAFFKLKLEKSTYTALLAWLPFNAFYTSPKLRPIYIP